MATAPRISYAAAAAMLDALTALLNVGGGTPLLRIYSGTQPTDPDAAVGGGTLLSEHNLSADVFGNAADQNPGARATAAAIADDTVANATGTAAWFRALDAAGTPVIDGSVGTASADLLLDDVNIVAGQTVKINSWVINMPQS